MALITKIYRSHLALDKLLITYIKIEEKKLNISENIYCAV